MGKPTGELDQITNFRSAMRAFALEVHPSQHFRRVRRCQAEIEDAAPRPLVTPFMNRISSSPRLVTPALSCLHPGENL